MSNQNAVALRHTRSLQSVAGSLETGMGLWTVEEPVELTVTGPALAVGRPVADVRSAVTTRPNRQPWTEQVDNSYC